MNSKCIYLDYAATTPTHREVFAAMRPFLERQFGNPSSLYGIGQTAKHDVSVARRQVAELIGAAEKEIYFTGSGSEADNWALACGLEKMAGASPARNELVISSIEHHAVLHTAEHLAKRGFVVRRVRPNSAGIIEPAAAAAAIGEKTAMVSIMLANNEIGTIQNIAAIAKIAKDAGALMHSDAVQAVGNIPVDVKTLGVDLLSMSAHKIYGPKGVGALYMKTGVNLPPLIYGGAQENNRRAGTENVAGIVGFGKAAELAKNNLAAHAAKTAELRNYLLSQIEENIPDIIINGSMDSRLPGNLNITFKYIEGEAILLLLDMAGIAVSTGSACSSSSLEPSHVLSEIGVEMEQIHGSIRFTVGDPTTKEEIDQAVRELSAAVGKLRAISAFN